MKSGVNRRVVGGLLALVAGLLLSALLIVGCADSGMSCGFDSDCAHGALCVENACADPCTSDLQCDGDESCQLFIRANEADQVLVCMHPYPYEPEDGNNITGLDACRSDKECREMLGSAEAMCGLNYRCVLPESGEAPESDGVGGADAGAGYDSVLILDRTVRALVDEDGHPGTVLRAVFVRDDAGSIVGYGDTLEFVSGEDEGVFLPGHLDGQPVQLDETGQCVSDADVSKSELGGEGGYYLVSFVDSHGARLWLETGWKVVVIAWGEQCGDYEALGHDEGDYDVLLCASDGDRVEDVVSSCDKIVEKVSGYAEFVVTSRW